MKQNQTEDNLMEDNPYSPPKSTDFRLPENHYQPTKGQRISRIILCVLCMSVFFSLFCVVVVIQPFSFLNDIIKDNSINPITGVIMVSLASIRFIIPAIIPIIVFSIFNTYHTPKNKIIYKLLSAVLLTMSMCFLDYLIFTDDSWFRDFNFHEFKILMLFLIGWILTTSLAVILFNPYYKKSFQAA